MSGVRPVMVALTDTSGLAPGVAVSVAVVEP